MSNAPLVGPPRSSTFDSALANRRRFRRTPLGFAKTLLRTLFQTLLAFPLGLSALEFAPVKVQIISPTNGSILHAQRLIGMQTHVEDTDGFITQLEVFAGTSSLAVATAPPFTIAFPAEALALGTNTLIARATDNCPALYAKRSRHLPHSRQPTIQSGILQCHSRRAHESSGLVWLTIGQRQDLPPEQSHAGSLYYAAR